MNEEKSKTRPSCLRHKILGRDAASSYPFDDHYCTQWDDHNIFSHIEKTASWKPLSYTVGQPQRIQPYRKNGLLKATIVHCGTTTMYSAVLKKTAVKYGPKIMYYTVMSILLEVSFLPFLDPCFNENHGSLRFRCSIANTNIYALVRSFVHWSFERQLHAPYRKNEEKIVFGTTTVT